MVTMKGLFTNVLKHSSVKYLSLNEYFKFLKRGKTSDNCFTLYGHDSTELKVKLHKTLKQLLPVCDLRVIFKVSLRMNNYFNFKDKIK